MEWSRLLSLKRYGDNNPRPRLGQDDLRLGFEVDYDRIIFSQHFRSLQDKTQVIPLSGTGFVHTRLTHSLEVSVVARSLGRMVGKQVLQRSHKLREMGYTFQDFGAITAAAALAHDIGNPPFGHSGEKALGSYFTSGQGGGLLGTLSRKQKHDLHHYEGNAHGYYLLNQDRPGTPGGLRLSCATLGAFVKYPRESVVEAGRPVAYHKKYGIFQADVPHFKEVARELSLLKGDNLNTCKRHPLAYLVEAADDICYSIIDFEDGINLGWISEDHALEQLIRLVGSTIKKEVYAQLGTRQERLSYLRSIAINTLIKSCAEVFMDNERCILDGTYGGTLMDQSQFSPQVEDILAITVEKVYRNPAVISKELAGHKILTGVLHDLVQAATAAEPGAYSKLLQKLVPAATNDGHKDMYTTLLATCSQVASMTDSDVYRLSKTLNGQL